MNLRRSIGFVIAGILLAGSPSASAQLSRFSGETPELRTPSSLFTAEPSGPSPGLPNTAASEIPRGGFSTAAPNLEFEDVPGVRERSAAPPSASPPARSPSGSLDLDTYLGAGGAAVWESEQDWEWQILPTSLLYKSYLAGVKETRLASHQHYLKGEGWVWEPILGAKVGLLRFGDRDPVRPQGFQVDVEGSAQARLIVPSDVDARSVDFRGGLPLTYAIGPHRFKAGYYHLSSHLGDEFLLKNPNYPRLNYARDVFIAGYSYYTENDLRIYGEIGWAFYTDVSQPWEFQTGIDYAPTRPTGIYGAPFFAVNGHLREELDFGGHFVAQAGWAWLSERDARLFRVGFHYFNGLSNQFSFYRNHEQQIGLGVWYDF